MEWLSLTTGQPEREAADAAAAAAAAAPLPAAAADAAADAAAAGWGELVESRRWRLWRQVQRDGGSLCFRCVRAVQECASSA